MATLRKLSGDGAQRHARPSASLDTDRLVSRVSLLKIGFDTSDEITNSSLVAVQQGADVVENLAVNGATPNTVNSSVRTREYLTEAEIERLMAAARKSSRSGYRDATMILIGYRHGLRASELCDLQWSQVEL